jgi:hypothetical protein
MAAQRQLADTFGADVKECCVPGFNPVSFAV